MATKRAEGPRRSPPPEQRRRDTERSRNALLDAALVEFAAKGFSGARVSEIAARAGVNKQLISYYFGGKEGLYRALVGRWLQEEAEFNRPELSLDELVDRYLQVSVRLRDVVRMFIRDGLAYEPAAGNDRPGEPRDLSEVDDLRRRQEAGEIAADLDPALLLLVLMGATSVGVTIPHEVKRLTGLEPTSPEFLDRYGATLRRVVRRLGEPPSD